MTIKVVSHSIEEQATKAVEETIENTPALAVAAEQKEVSDSEPEKTEEKEESKEEIEAKDGGEDSEEDGDKPKKKGGFQRRIDKLNARNAAAQAEIDRLNALVSRGAGEQKAEKVETKVEASDDEPRADDFETHAEYSKAVGKWAAKQVLKERDAELNKAKLEAEQKNIWESHSKREAAFAEKVEDYKELVTEFIESNPTVSQTIQSLIVSSENGPELLYAFAKDEAEFKRINSLPPIAAARELGKLESRLSKPSEPKQEPKKITKAPQPIVPVGSKGGAVAKSIDDPNLSQREYERLRAEQEKQKHAS